MRSECIIMCRYSILLTDYLYSLAPWIAERLLKVNATNLEPGRDCHRRYYKKITL